MIFADLIEERITDYDNAPREIFPCCVDAQGHRSTALASHFLLDI